MKRFFGIGVGLVWYGLAFGAFRNASAGWDAGHSDLGFWWTVISALLAIAATGALVGTIIHTRRFTAS